MPEGQGDFLPKLQEALAARAALLDATTMPSLRTLLGTYRALFETVAGTLVRKGALRGDPFDQEISSDGEALPSDSALSESGDNRELSRRVVEYRHQLAALFDILPASVAAFDPSTVDKLTALLSYIDWKEFGEGSRSHTTRALSRLVANIRLSPDALSSQILHDSQDQIDQTLVQVQAYIAELQSWQRESWKAQARALGLPRSSTGPGPVVAASRTEELAAMRKVFEAALPAVQWHTDLAREILIEERGEDGAARKEKLLATLMPPKPEVVEEKPPDHRGALLDAIRNLGRSRDELTAAETVLVGNEDALERRTLGFFQRIRRWFHRNWGRLDDRFYEVEVTEAPGAEPRKRTIGFLKFIAEVRDMEGALGELAEGTGPSSAKVAAMNEQRLADLLEWQIRQLGRIHRRMDGLNAYFQIRAADERGVVARSIRLELLAIENALARAEQARKDNIVT